MINRYEISPSATTIIIVYVGGSNVKVINVDGVKPVAQMIKEINDLPHTDQEPNIAELTQVVAALVSKPRSNGNLLSNLYLFGSFRPKSDEPKFKTLLQKLSQMYLTFTVPAGTTPDDTGYLSRIIPTSKSVHSISYKPSMTPVSIFTSFIKVVRNPTYRVLAMKPINIKDLTTFKTMYTPSAISKVLPSRFTAQEKPKAHKVKMELIYIMDTSKDTKKSEFDGYKSGIIEIVKQYEISPEFMTIHIIYGDGSGIKYVSLPTMANGQSGLTEMVTTSLKEIVYSGKDDQMNLALAFTTLANVMQQPNGFRPGSNRLLLFAGKFNIPQATVPKMKTTMQDLVKYFGFMFMMPKTVLETQVIAPLKPASMFIVTSYSPSSFVTFLVSKLTIFVKVKYVSIPANVVQHFMQITQSMMTVYVKSSFSTSQSSTIQSASCPAGYQKVGSGQCFKQGAARTCASGLESYKEEVGNAVLLICYPKGYSLASVKQQAMQMRAGMVQSSSGMAMSSFSYSGGSSQMMSSGSGQMMSSGSGQMMSSGSGQMMSSGSGKMMSLGSGQMSSSSGGKGCHGGCGK
ncbi:uncharacterized protein LOC141906203 [Tubulanus polymorphus]|uniref:uncharacterized protein LOC141906203 n=1 Tax=Tubulanus polymorphus TaxID=672921 RepID=UPI003DA39DC5